MFIELTDHLRCPAGHEEAFLVLLPGRMEGRRVVTGTLGCPVCGRVVTLRDGWADFGSPPAAAADAAPGALTAPGLHALLGLEGPGGFVALVAGAAALAADLAPLLPGVRFALVNPAPGAADTEAASVLHAPRLPLKASSMRAVALGAPAGGDPRWVEEALAAVLPGNRLVVEGPLLERPEWEVLARTGGLWVARKLNRPRR